MESVQISWRPIDLFFSWICHWIFFLNLPLDSPLDSFSGSAAGLSRRRMYRRAYLDLLSARDATPLFMCLNLSHTPRRVSGLPWSADVMSQSGRPVLTLRTTEGSSPDGVTSNKMGATPRTKFPGFTCNLPLFGGGRFSPDLS